MCLNGQELEGMPGKGKSSPFRASSKVNFFIGIDDCGSIVYVEGSILSALPHERKEFCSESGRG